MSDERAAFSEISDSEWLRNGEEYAEEIERYMKAVDEHVGTTKLRPMPHYVIAQLQPKPQFRGGIYAPQPQYPSDGRPPVRFGTVLAVGEHIRDTLSPGDEILFSRMLGKRFPGMYNPLDSKGDDAIVDWSDEIRVFKMDVENDHYEIIGRVEFDLIGEEVVFEPPGGEPRTGEVVNESTLLGGIVKVDAGDGPEWVPQRYVERRGE